jgi:hypothetical protein
MDLGNNKEYETNKNKIISKKIIKIKLNDEIKKNYLEQSAYYNMINIDQFIDYFLIDNYNYIFVNDYESSDISIWNEQLDDNKDLQFNKINMIISVENLSKWHWYLHYNKYNNYNDDKINIYLYNHISKIEISLTEKNNYIAIPLIHFYINYYKKKENLYNYQLTITEYKSKKFCLCINKSNLNPELNKYINILKNIENIDYINIYNDKLNDKSCYHSIQLLNIFNQYKFILIFENSYCDGYITEKIFNSFFSKSIPIYKGSPIIKNYINDKSFIDINSYNDEELLELVLSLNNNEEFYNSYININKISDNYNDEDYNNILYNFIENQLELNKMQTILNK